MPRCAILPPVPVPYREPLFARLAERGRIEPIVIYQAGGQPGWDQRPEWFPAEHGYRARALRSWQRGRPGRSSMIVPRGLGGALRSARPDCVVSWEYGPATLRALAWCRLRGRPLVIFSELTEHAERELSPRRRRLHGLLASRAAGFVVASSAARRRLEAMGVGPDRVEVALQSADVDRFARAAASRSTPEGGPVKLLSVGRLVPDKNLGTLIDAFADAGLDPGEAELELRGTGPLEQELKQLAAQRGAAVRIDGYASPDELPELYAQAGALLLVSTYEPFGVTMREGAAAGLPLICSRVAGAVGDVAVEGENALLVDPHDRGQIADALRRIVRDGELRARLAAGSRAVTERHPSDADAEAFERAVLRATAR
ncbi:MAG TPA: glycosyltransferase family 4 protein [Thermoleophilaceae bacterium]|nr:glycosyltransferase family 4 protein [Thermoleophilaceae bacterium]